MPFVRIDLKQDLPEARRRALADGVQAALVDSIGIPADDRFQIITSHGAGMIYDPGYLGIDRSDGIVMIEIHLSFGRTLALKKALFKAIHDRLVGLGLRGEDVMIHLVETESVNWSFGHGLAQYADKPPAFLSQGQQ